MTVDSVKKSEFILWFSDKFPPVAKIAFRLWAYTYILKPREVHWLFIKLKEKFRFRFKHRTYLLSKYPIIVDPFDSVGNAILNHGCYERETVELLQHIIDPGMVIIDAGAHIGQYTILFSELVTKVGRVYSFEPDPDTFKQLVENIELNAVANVDANNIALSDFTGSGTLFLAENTNIGGNSLRPQQSFAGSKIDTKVMKLDEFASNARLNRLDLIKADIEGAELLLLEGGKSVIMHFKPMLILELSPTQPIAFGYKLEDIYNRLISWDYCIYRIAERPFKSYLIQKDDPVFFNVLAVQKSHINELKKKKIL